MADFFDVVRRQRAYRELLPDPVPESLIENLLEAATYAPSAENSQPWVFVVVRDAELRARIGAIVREAWEGFAREISRPNLSERFFAAVDRWATGGLAAAPVIIVVCVDASLTHEVTLPSSVFPATQNLLLAAQALGLGSLLSTLPVVVGPQLGELLALPAHIQPMAALPIGWPARKLGPPRRISFREKSFRDRYGERW